MFTPVTGGQGVSGSSFRIAPTISGFSPAAGAPNSSITISGANLNEGLTNVSFGSVTASFTNVQFGQVTALVPLTATTGPISLTTSNGTVSSVTNFFLPASIASFTPNNGPPGTPVQITGANFPGASVAFNGTLSTNFTVTDNAHITAEVPLGATSGPISIMTPAGSADTGAQLFYLPPVITSFTPTHGLPGTNVTIFGTNFTGFSTVQFGGLTAASTAFIDNRTIQAVVPENAASGRISVETPAGTADSPTAFLLDFASELAVSMTGSPDPVFVGGNLVYTIVISNAGPFTAPNVFLTNTLDPTVTLVSNSVPQAVLAGAVSWTNLPSASAGTISLTVVPQAPGTITNRVAVTSGYPDPVPGNNSATLITTVLPLPLLSIQPSQIGSSKLIRIMWPSALTNYVLQLNSGLTTNTAWSNAPASQIEMLSGGTNLFQDSVEQPSKFYRLKH